MKKRFTISQIIFIFIIMLIMVQSIVYISMFQQFDIEDKLKSNDVSTFYNHLHARTKFLDSLFNDRWANLEYVNGISNAAAKRYDISKMTERLTIDVDVVFSLINMNENMRANGAYIILKNNSTGSLDSFVIKDSNPIIQSDTLSDITVQIGDKNISNSIGLALHTNWNPNINLVESREDSLYRIFQIMERNAINRAYETSNWGYWSELKLSSESPDSISYCIPLISKKTNEFYGIVGVVIEKDFLLSNSFKSLYFDNHSNSFSIAKRIRHSQIESETLKKVDSVINSENSIFFKNIVTSNIVNSGKDNSFLFDDEIGIYETEHSFGENLLYKVMSKHDLSQEKPENAMFAVFSPIKLYGTNSSFIGEDWYIVNYMYQEDLFAPANSIINNLYTPIGFIILAEIIFFIIIASMSVKEMNLLISNIKILARNTSSKVEYHSRIYEVDQIFKTIQNLNLEIVNFSSKMEQIIESTDIKIGAVELFKMGKDVIITGSTADLLGFEQEYSNLNVVSRNYFNEKFQHFISVSRIFDSKTDENSNKITITYEIPNLFYKNKYNDLNKDFEDLSYITISKIKKNNRILYILVDETEKINNIIKIRFERDHDALTGLLNDKAFKEKVSGIIDSRIGNGAMIMWDLDNLKYINDNYGHSAGDEYIRATAKILSSANFKNFVLARVAGDEFYAFTYNYMSEESVLKELENLKEKLNSTVIDLSGFKFQIRASTGVSWFKKDSNDVGTLIKYADFAMYNAKKSQKGTIREFDISKYNSDFILSNNSEYISKFIENKELKYAFQPIVSLKNLQILGYEAFMRPTSGNIKSPYGVLRMAKSQSKLDSIEKMTWLNAIEEYHKQPKSHSNAKLFINSFSSISLSDEDKEFLRLNYGDLIEHVVMEIIDHEHINLDTLDDAKFQYMWSCKVSIDDFDEDYSEHISNICLNSNFMKVDMSIIRNIDSDAGKQKIFKKLVEIAHYKHIEVIAEGVETQEELTMIISLGADYAQGFFIAFPDYKITDINVEKKNAILKIIEEIS